MPRARLLIVILFASGVLAWAFADDGIRKVAAGVSLLLQFGNGRPIPVSSGALSEHDIEQLNAMSPQDQATRLLEKAINNYSGAGAEFARRLDSWTDAIQSTPDLTRLTDTAFYSSDLRIRTMALELWLLRDHIRKTPESADSLIQQAGLTDGKQYYRLSTLGILGNRGIEPERIADTLQSFVHAPSGDTRAAAINGLALLGTEATIAPLLEIFRWDQSADLRERAACSLADSGMLTRDLRQKAVPELIRFAQDETLDSMTRKWVFQALREISGQNLPDQADAWVRWHQSRPAE